MKYKWNTIQVIAYNEQLIKTNEAQNDYYRKLLSEVLKRLKHPVASSYDALENVIGNIDTEKLVDWYYYSF